MQYRGLTGMPEVGWHADTYGVDRRRGGLRRCSREDPLAKTLLYGDADKQRETPRLLREIEARGPGRLVAGRRWEEEGGTG